MDKYRLNSYTLENSKVTETQAHEPLTTVITRLVSFLSLFHRLSL